MQELGVAAHNTVPLCTASSIPASVTTGWHVSVQETGSCEDVAMKHACGQVAKEREEAGRGERGKFDEAARAIQAAWRRKHAQLTAGLRQAQECQAEAAASQVSHLVTVFLPS